MHPLLNQNLFLVKEHVGVFKAANNYDVFDPQSGSKVMECREPNLGAISKLLRFTDYKQMTPFDVHVTDNDGRSVLRVRRGVSFFLSKVEVLDGGDRAVGGFHQKLFSIGGAFSMVDTRGNPLCDLKGKWRNRDFTVFKNGREIARVARKWSGFGKELFTSADNYMLSIDPNAVPAASPLRPLILGAVLCVDMVLKE
jgi:uncharacterized protein YxjI